MDYTVHGIFQARILEWVAFPSPGDRPNSGIKSGLSNCRQVLYQLGHKRSPVAAAAKLLQSCPTLCDPIDGSPTGSTIPGILQARILEWVAIPFSNAWKWKVEVKSLRRVRLSATPWTADYQAPPSMGFSRQEYHCLLPNKFNKDFKNGPHQKKKKTKLKNKQTQTNADWR